MKVGAFPSSWRRTTLSEIAAPVPNAIVDGPFGSNLKLSDYVADGVPVLQGKNITNDTFRWFEVRFISESKAADLKRSSVRVGDVLIVKIGSIGYSAIVDDLRGFEFAIIPANLAKVTPDRNKIHLRYLHKWLTSVHAKRYFAGAASKTAQPALSLEKIRNLPIPLPPLAEQRRIAEILDRAEALRTKRRAALAQLDSLTQSIFLDLFGDPLAKNGNRPHVQFETVTHRITYGFTCPMKHLESGIPIVTAKNVRDGFIDFDNVHYADKAEFDSLTAKSKPVLGDVVITKDGTIGRCAVVETNQPFCINQSVALVLPDCSKVLPSYLVAYLSTSRVQHVMQNMGKGNALAHLQITELAKLPMPLPSLEQQREFARRIEAVEKLKITQRASLAELYSLFASLQHRAFRGEL